MVATAEGLQRHVQEDFSVGVERDVAPHLISGKGLYGAINALFNDDGSVYKRGGSVSQSDAAFGASGRGVWDGWLQPGRRTLIASQTAFGVLASDDESPINLGGSGFANVPRVMRELEGMLFISAPSSGGTGTIYGGSRKEADYSTGTVKVVKDSRTVTGTGTAWKANVDVGMLFRLAGERVYVVSSVDSDTQITLRDPYEGAGGEGKAYSLKRLEAMTAPYKSSSMLAVVSRRLVVCEGQDVWLSEPGKPHLYKATIQPSGKEVDTRHTIAEGVQVLGAEALGRESLLVFTTHGVWRISNLANAIVDGLGNAQHRLDQVSRDLVLLGNAGITGWRNALIVPCVDDVFIFDGVSEPEPVSRSIRPLYRSYVESGYTVGHSHVYLDHLFLPIIDSNGSAQDLLVCRLDRPTTVRGQRLSPWSIMRDAGAKVSAVEVRAPSGPADPPLLLASASDGRLLNLARYFTPGADVKNDHDGETHRFEISTRDWSNDALAIVRWRKLRGRYEMEVDEGDEDSLLYADIGSGLRKTAIPQWGEEKWAEFKWASSQEIEYIELEGGGAVPNAGPAAELAQNAKEWFSAERLRYARFRLRTTDPVARLTIRGIEVFSSVPGGVRHSKVT